MTAAGTPLMIPHPERVIPAFVAALGYTGPARWISVHWRGREAGMTDGLGFGVGFFDAYWTLLVDPRVREQTQNHQLQSSRMARARLVIDREDNAICVVPFATYRSETDPVLVQWAGGEPPELDADRFTASAPVHPGDDLEATLIRPQQERIATLLAALSGEAPRG